MDLDIVGRMELETIVSIRQLARSGEARRIREAAGLSLRELAAAVGVDAASISRWERGLSAPRVHHALAWHKALMVAVAPVARSWANWSAVG